MEETIMQSLFNFGGLGVALAMLFYLHTTGIRAVREEMQAERDRCDRHLQEERQLWKESVLGVVERLDRIEKKVDFGLAAGRPVPAVNPVSMGVQSR